MTVTAKKEENTCILTVEGRLDTLTAPEFDKAVEEHLDGCEKMVIDMAGVDYISSAGIRSVLKAHHTVGGDNFVLRSLSKNAREIFRMTGFEKALNIE